MTRPGLLAGVAAGDAADPLLVDPLRGGRREVHADRRPRRVPALGEQHRVAEDVDLAALEGGEGLGQLALRRLAGDGAGVDPEVAHRLGDVVGVLDAGGVDDAGDALEARAVEVGDRDVERPLVEQLGELLLVEVLVDLAAAQRHVGERPHARPRRDPDAAQRRDHAATRRLGEIEARGLGREEVGDVAGDQGAGRGHADEDRALPVADAGAGLLAERRVGLVADHDRVGVGDLAGVADEPLVGLDGDRPVGVVLALEQRRREAVGVAAVGDLADELVDEVAAVGEDQDAAGPRGLDEADGGDGLAGAGRVLEPEAAAGVGIVGGLGDDVVVLLGAVGSSQSCGSSSSASESSSSCRRRCRTGVELPLPLPPPLPLRFEPGSSISEMTAARVPESASTWCSESSAPSSSSGRSSARTRSSPSSSEKSWRQLRRGLLEALVELDQRGVEGEPAGGARAAGPRASRRRAGSAHA